MLLRTVDQGRDFRFDVYKFEALKVAALLAQEPHLKHYSDRIYSCANSLKFKLCEDGTIRLSQAYFCRVRCCPLCAWRKSLMWRGRAIKLLPQFKGRKFIFATFTIRNPPLDDLRVSLIKMKSSFRKMSFKRNKLWHFDGSVKSFEITKGNVQGCCHPHLHCLLTNPQMNYMSVPEWVAMWRYYLACDYDPVVYLQLVKNVKSIIPEIFKYVCKPADLSDKDFLIAYLQASKNMHFIELSGFFSDLFKTTKDDDNQDLIHSALGDSDEQGSYLCFTWSIEEEKSFQGNDMYAYQV